MLPLIPPFPAATVERLAGGNQLLGRLGGKKVAGKLGDKRELREERRNQVVGSTRLPPLEQLWCPPPQSTTHHLELHGEAGVAGVLTFDLQYAFRRVTQSTRGALVCTSALPRVPCLLSAYYKCTVLDWSEESRLFDGMGETLETIHKKAHKLFRVLVQSLARSEAAHAARECEREGAHDGGVGSGMTLAPAVGWLFDQFCEIFGVGEPYRRLYELRVVLSGFEPSAGCLGRVSVALNDVLHLKELGITDWTTDELDMYQAMRLHLQESLSRCFLYYKSIFPPTSVHSGALELAAHIFCVLTPDGADELLRTNVMQHADKTVAMILRGADVEGGMVRPRVLSCLLRELRKELVEDHDFYGPVFPQDVRLVETHCSQYFGVDSRVRNAIANCVMNMDEKAYFEDEALQLYDDAANVAMYVAEISPDTELMDLKHLFSPILEAHTSRSRDRMLVWAHRAALSDDCTMICASATPHDHQESAGEDNLMAEGLHSHGVDDLFGFCMQGLRRLAEMCSREAAFDVFCDVMTRYCDTVVAQCERVLKEAAPVQSENVAPARASEEVAEMAKKGLASGWRAMKKLVSATEAMVDQRSIRGGLSLSAQDDEDDEDEGTQLHFEVPADFWVRLNNLWALSEQRVQPVAVDAAQLFGIEETEPDFLDSPAQLHIEERTLQFVSRVRTQVAEVLRRLVGLSQPALRAEVKLGLQAFARGDRRPAGDVWQPVLDGLDSVLALPHETTYAPVFQRLTRQISSAYFNHLEDFLSGEASIKQWHSPDLMEIKIEEVVEISKNWFSDGGVSASRLRRLTDKKTVLGRLLILHTQDTQSLIGQYRSITNEISSRLQATATSAAQQMGDQVAEIAGVLQCRRIDAQAREFVAEIGVAAHGRVPATLNLDQDEQLCAKATCRHRLPGTLYVTTSWLCFAARAEQGLEGSEREQQEKEESEAAFSIDIREISYLLKERSSTGRETVLEVGTRAEETLSIHGFRNRGLRDDMYQHICARAASYGLRLSVEDDETWTPLRRMFGLAATETLLNSFGCSVSNLEQHAFGSPRGSVANGRLYVSSSFVCFRETGSSRAGVDKRFKFVLPFASIQAAETKAQGLLGLGLVQSLGVIDITTLDGVEYTLSSFNMVTRDSALVLLRQRIEACAGENVIMRPDGLSGGSAEVATEKLTIRRGENGSFGMEIEEDGVVVGYIPAAGTWDGSAGVAELAGVPIGARISKVDGIVCNSRAEVTEQLPGTDEEQEGRPPEVVFEFTHPSLTPPPAVTAEPPPSGVTASSGSVPYTISLFTSDGEDYSGQYAMTPPSSAVAVRIQGAQMMSAERKITASQRTDFHPGERVDFRLEAADLGELQKLHLRLTDAPTLSSIELGHLRHWHMSHAVVTNSITMQTWTFVADCLITDQPTVAVDVVEAPPTFVRTVVEELFQHERRLTQFSRFSTRQMFPTDRPPWADVRNQPCYKDSVCLPDSSWRWDGDWEVDCTASCDAQGWGYGFNWKSSFVSEPSVTCFVRRRRWVRVRRRGDREPEPPMGHVPASASAPTDNSMHTTGVESTIDARSAKEAEQSVVAPPATQSAGPQEGGPTGEEAAGLVQQEQGQLQLQLEEDDAEFVSDEEAAE